MSAEELGLEGPEFDKEIRFYHPETGAETLVMQSRYMNEKLWDKNNELLEHYQLALTEYDALLTLSDLDDGLYRDIHYFHTHIYQYVS